MAYLVHCVSIMDMRRIPIGPGIQIPMKKSKQVL